MRLTVLQQMAKDLPQASRGEEETYDLRDVVVRFLERLKRSSWRPNPQLFDALHPAGHGSPVRAARSKA
jgi:hypothetical protein